MRVLVIGGTGHIGTYLVPSLVEAGHEVISLSRGRRSPYQGAPAWGVVKQIQVDRSAEEKAGTFGQRVRQYQAAAIVDLICYRPESAQMLAEAVRGQVRHFLHCGTLWVHGPTEVAPVSESQPRRPTGDYGIRKAAIESYLMELAQRDGFPATILHPGHIVGPGWSPINPLGNLNLSVFEALATGQEVLLPDQGLATLHHVHAADVAQSFMKALSSWSASVGESFHIVSPAALTLRGFAIAVAGWFGQEAKLTYVPWEAWKGKVSQEDANATWEHISRCPCASIEKARRCIQYEPRYSSLEAIREALAWLIANGKVNAPKLS